MLTSSTAIRAPRVLIFRRVKGIIEKKAHAKLALLKESGLVSLPSDIVNDKVNFNIGGAGPNGVPALNKLEQAALLKKLPASERKAPAKKAAPKKVTKTEKTKVFGKKKEQRKVLDKLTAGSISADPAVHHTKRSGPVSAPRLRKSITPGTVLILLAGKFAGKRVVFLKQLPSGLLLVTGPFKLNGVPMRRVSPQYVIATSTKVDVTSVSLPETVTDKFFVKQKESLPRGEKKFFKGEKKTGEKRTTEIDAFNASEERKTLQESVDTPVLAAVEKVQYLGDYLKTRFTLSDKDRPHEMKF